MILVVLLKTDCNAKITEIEGKIPCISGLAANVALTAIGNTISNTSSLVKKTDYNTRLQKLKRNLLINIIINILQL